MHYALEDLHGVNTYGHPSRAFEAYVKATLHTGSAPESWRELGALGVEMMSYYKDYWLDHANRDYLETYIHDEVPQTEVRFIIDLPISGPNGEPVKYRGQIDRVAIDEHGMLWVVEYKSAKDFRIHHFDVDDQISAYCVPLNTEILTRKGWKKYDQLIIGEEVLGYNSNSGKLEWTSLEDIRVFRNQETVVLSNKSFQFTCTPDHNWVQVNENNTWPYKRGNIQLKPIKAGQQHHYTILSAPLDCPTLDITNDEASLLGWLFTDGTHTLGDRASICQKKYTEEIQSLLDRLPGSYTRITDDGNGTLSWHLSMKFLNPLYKRAGINHTLHGWQEFLLGISNSARESFCSAALQGDGTTNDTFYQKEGLKHDLFKMAFFLTGVFPTASRVGGKGNKWSQENKNTFHLGAPHKWVRTIKSDPSTPQDVWCPQTGLRTWVMRQNGQIAITGNCWAAQTIYQRPVAGVVYQQHKKSIPYAPRILATGKVSVNKQMNTSYALYRKTLMDVYGDPSCFPDENIRFLNTLVEESDEDSDKFIRRDRIYRNQYQIAAQGEKILLELEDMLRVGLPLYPNPGKDCSWSCPLTEVCIAMDDGSDFSGLLDALATDRQEIDDSWRIHLPHPDLLQQAPIREELQIANLQELLEQPEPKTLLAQMLELEW